MRDYACQWLDNISWPTPPNSLHLRYRILACGSGGDNLWGHARTATTVELNLIYENLLHMLSSKTCQTIQDTRSMIQVHGLHMGDRPRRGRKQESTGGFKGLPYSSLSGDMHEVF